MRKIEKTAVAVRHIGVMILGRDPDPIASPAELVHNVEAFLSPP